MELDAADVEVLVRLLQRNIMADDGMMDFEMLDGFLCGVIVAPKLLMPSQWLPKVLGEQPFETSAQAEAATGALLRLYNAVVQRLAADFDEDEDPPLRIYVHRLNPDGSLIESLADADDNEDVKPPQADAEAETVDDDEQALLNVGALWALGFALSTQLAEKAWEQAAEELELFDEVLRLCDMLMPVFPGDDADADDDGPFDDDEGQADDDAGERVDEEPCDEADDEGPLTTVERAIALGEVSEVLHELYLLNQRRMAPPQTFRRNAPKVGRNDPCPCGSGRKYKRCHGAN
jgi:uncharacterized protein